MAISIFWWVFPKFSLIWSISCLHYTLCHQHIHVWISFRLYCFEWPHNIPWPENQHELNWIMRPRPRLIKIWIANYLGLILIATMYIRDRGMQTCDLISRPAIDFDQSQLLMRWGQDYNLELIGEYLRHWVKTLLTLWHLHERSWIVYLFWHIFRGNFKRSYVPL